MKAIKRECDLDRNDQLDKMQTAYERLLLENQQAVKKLEGELKLRDNEVASLVSQLNNKEKVEEDAQAIEKQMQYLEY